MDCIYLILSKSNIYSLTYSTFTQLNNIKSNKVRMQKIFKAFAIKASNEDFYLLNITTNVLILFRTKRINIIYTLLYSEIIGKTIFYKI